MHRQFIYSLLAATALTGFAAQAFADNSVDLSNYSDSNETFNLTQISGDGNAITVGSDTTLAPMQGNSNVFTLSEVGNANNIGVGSSSQGVGERVTRSNINISATGNSNIAEVHMNNADQSTVNTTINGNNNGNPNAGAWRANVVTIAGNANTANTILNGDTNSTNMSLTGNANTATMDFEGNQNSGETNFEGNNNVASTLVIGSNNGGPFINTIGDNNNDQLRITGTNSSVNIEQGAYSAYDQWQSPSVNGIITASLNGDQNTAWFNQYGNNNNMTASATGKYDLLNLSQTSLANGAGGNNMNATETGNGDSIQMVQYGDHNNATVTLAGTDNTVSASGVFGNGNTQNVTIYDGYLNDASVEARGDNNIFNASIGSKGDAIDATTWDKETLIAYGNGNTLTGSQEGSSDVIDTAVAGNNNQVTFSQTGSQNVIAMNNLIAPPPNGPIGLTGSGNNITGTQTGSNNVMLIGVTGDSNTLNNTQAGYDMLYETVNGANNNIAVNQTAGSSGLQKSITLNYTGSNANVKLNQ